MLGRNMCWVKALSRRQYHGDVVKWKHFPRYWPFLCGDSPHNGQRCGTKMYSLICAWTYGSTDNRDVSDLIRHRAPYDVAVMMMYINLPYKQVYWDVGHSWGITMTPHERHGVSNQQLTQTNNEENIRTPHQWWKIMNFIRSNAKNVPISWRHHVSCNIESRGPSQ